MSLLRDGEIPAVCGACSQPGEDRAGRAGQGRGQQRGWVSLPAGALTWAAFLRLSPPPREGPRAGEREAARGPGGSAAASEAMVAPRGGSAARPLPWQRLRPPPGPGPPATPGTGARPARSAAARGARPSSPAAFRCHSSVPTPAWDALLRPARKVTSIYKTISPPRPRLRVGGSHMLSCWKGRGRSILKE